MCNSKLTKCGSDLQIWIFLNISSHPWDHRVIWEVKRGLCPDLLPQQGQLWGPTWLLRAWSTRALQTSKDGNGTTSLDKLLPCLTALMGKTFLLVCSVDLYLCNVCLLSLILLPHTKRWVKGHNHSPPPLATPLLLQPRMLLAPTWLAAHQHVSIFPRPAY